MKRFITLAYFLLLILLLFPGPVLADGIIIPEPPICGDVPCPDPILPPVMNQLVIRVHHVSVEIADQVAVTRIDQVFFNPNDWTVEGLYIFPLPADAAVSEFRLWIDGKAVQGEILDAEQARRVYEEIVIQLKDPALLEYADRGAVRARIFPIPPGGERRIELSYSQVLPAENGLVRYQYPLNTEKFSALPLENVSITVDVQDPQPIRAVYSPSHAVSVSREAPGHVIAGYEGSNVLPDSDFVLYYSRGREQAFHLLSYRDPEDPDDPDGFFALLLAPRPDAVSQSLPKDVLLVLDRSGSMEGDKIRQAQDALRYILDHLNPEDRFNVVAFSTGVETFAKRLQSLASKEAAIAWVERQSALGSTDIHRALLETVSMADRERPTYLIFLTDGLPTEGVIDSQKILDDLARSAPANLRLFAFGVGYDVDTFLLDSLAQDHHGTSTYVLPGERLDEILSAFYARISSPVLTDLALDFGTVRVYDLYPTPLPDLFAGSQIVVIGRYRQGGTTTVVLTGQIDGQEHTFRFPEQTFAREQRRIASGGPEAALPRLWATRKIGHLLNRIRLQGPDSETIDQIVRLSIRYGIVTPYTSYLVTEPQPLGMEAQERIANEQFLRLQASPAEPAYGQDAVEKAVEQGALAGADTAQAPPAEVASTVRIVGARTFVLADGVWVDTAFDPERTRKVEVAFLSDDYFALGQARPDLAAAFALGPRVIAVSGGMAYEVVEAGAAVEPVDIPQVSTAAPIPETTSVPVLDPPVQTSPIQDPAPGALSCLGGLLPGAVLLAGFLAYHRRLAN